MPFNAGKNTVALRHAALLCVLPACLVACVSVGQPTGADLTVLVTAQDLARFTPDHQINYERVKVQKVQVASLSLLTYEYHPGEGLYLSSEASVGPQGSGEEHAKRSIRGLKAASWFKGEDLEIEEQPIPSGLDSGTRFFLLRSQGQPIGNAYVTYDDRRAMYLMFSGVYFSDVDQFATFIKPKLEALTNSTLGSSAS